MNSFGENARRLARLSALMLSWRPHEFWAATPAELATVLTPEAGTVGAPLVRDEMLKLMEHDDA